MTDTNVTKMMPGTNTPAGTDLASASTRMRVSHYLGDEGSAIIEIDLTEILGEGDQWEFDSVIGAGSAEAGVEMITLRYVRRED